MDRANACSRDTLQLRVSLDDAAAIKLADRELPLLPGMPVEVFIAAGQHTLADDLPDPRPKQLHNTIRKT